MGNGKAMNTSDSNYAPLSLEWYVVPHRDGQLRPYLNERYEIDDLGDQRIL